MACFLVPGTEAIVTTVATKVLEYKGKKEAAEALEQGVTISEDAEKKLHVAKALKPLNNLLWGGSVLLAVEHVWHGEVIPVYPFLTAATNAADTAAMLQEMSTVGVGMAGLVTAVWGVMTFVGSKVKAREGHTETL